MQNNSENLESYWSNRYVESLTGWDLGLVSPPLKAYFDQLEDKDLKILIPGAGNAYEAEYLFRSGFKNTYVIDVSQIPLDNLKERVPDFPEDQMILGDFFTLQGSFDLIVEQTFFCSFPPKDNNRENYVNRMSNLLTNGGKLVGLWFDFPFKGDYERRPFGCTKPEYIELFKDAFNIKVLETSFNSVEERMGKEVFGILVKK